MGKATGKTIRATRIEVLDKDGRVRLLLGCLGQGDGDVFGIVVRDQHGRDRAAMLHDGPSAEVALDYDGNTVAALAVAADGRAELVVAD